MKEVKKGRKMRRDIKKQERHGTEHNGTKRDEELKKKS
jgi:hypothetical protein